jgi:hypothetical protein
VNVTVILSLLEDDQHQWQVGEGEKKRSSDGSLRWRRLNIDFWTLFQNIFGKSERGEMGKWEAKEEGRAKGKRREARRNFAIIKRPEFEVKWRRREDIEGQKPPKTDIHFWRTSSGSVFKLRCIPGINNLLFLRLHTECLLLEI